MDPAYTSALEKIRSATTTKDRLRFTEDLAHSIPDEDVEKWLTGNLFKEADASLVAFFRSILFGRYSSIDPTKCAVAMEKAKDPGLKAHLRRWAEGDHQAVLELASKSADVNFRRSLLEAGLTALAKTDPAAALAVIEQQGTDYVSLDEVMAVISGSNRQMLLDWADHPRQDNIRDEARGSIAKAWFQQDFNGALSWAKQQDDAKSLISQSLYTLGLSPSGYLDKIGSLPPELITPVLQKAIKSGRDLDAWLAYDYEGKAGLSTEQAKAVRTSVILRLAFVDTPKAFEALKIHGLPDRVTDRNEFINIAGGMNQAFEAMGGTVLEEWKKILGEDAEDLPKFGNANAGKLNVPVPPADAVKQLAETGKVTDTGFITQWTREDMRQAIEAIPSIPAEQLGNLRERISSRNYPIEFQAAVLAEAARKDVKFYPYSYANLGYQMARGGPAAATEWAKALPEGKPRDLVIRGVTAHMQAVDPVQAGKWMEGLDAADRSAAEQVIHHLRTVHGK